MRYGFYMIKEESIINRLKKAFLYFYSILKHNRAIKPDDISYIVLCGRFPEAVVIGTKKTVNYYKSMGEMCGRLGLTSKDFT